MSNEEKKEKKPVDCLLLCLENREWQSVNLNELYLKSKYRNKQISLEEQEQLVQSAPGVCTYGGFGEDRSDIWKGFEKDARKMTHLGIDINNLYPGDQVFALDDCQVVHVLRDRTPHNGWGERLILKNRSVCPKYPYLLLGHLIFDRVPREGDRFKKGYEVGLIADGKHNGGWFPHLHVQMMSEKMMKAFENKLDELDGYHFTKTIDQLSDWVTDPTPYVFEFEKK